MYDWLKVLETANTVFLKIDDGIYEVYKDRNEQFSGALYVGIEEVINELNSNLKVAIVKLTETGVPVVIHFDE
jgi:hypothetical protein